MNRHTFLGFWTTVAAVLSIPKQSEAALTLTQIRLQLPAILSVHLRDLTFGEVDLCERAQTEDVTQMELRLLRKLVRQYGED